MNKNEIIYNRNQLNKLNKRIDKYKTILESEIFDLNTLKEHKIASININLSINKSNDILKFFKTVLK